MVDLVTTVKIEGKELLDGLNKSIAEFKALIVRAEKVEKKLRKKI